MSVDGTPPSAPSYVGRRRATCPRKPTPTPIGSITSAVTSPARNAWASRKSAVRLAGVTSSNRRGIAVLMAGGRLYEMASGTSRNTWRRHEVQPVRPPQSSSRELLREMRQPAHETLRSLRRAAVVEGEVLLGVRDAGPRRRGAARSGELHAQVPRRPDPLVEDGPGRRAQAGDGALRGPQGLPGA